MKSTQARPEGVVRDLLTAPPPGRFRRLAVGAAAVLLAAGGISAWVLLRDGGDNPAARFRTEPAMRGSLTVTITATGNLEPTNQVDVGTEISGTIKEVLVKENDKVTVGQVLASLDTRKLEAQAMQAEASLAAARARVLQSDATVAEARNQLARLKTVSRLSSGRAASTYDLDSAQAALDRALADAAANRAGVQQAEAALRLVRTDLGKAVIHSPINGIVLTRSAEPGQTVAASLQAPVLFKLAEDLTRMELHVAVDEADVGQVKPGQPAAFSVDAYPERRYQAEITQVNYGSQTTDNVVTYETVLKVDNADMSLRPGMTATAEITVNQVKDALLVPNAALRFSPPVADASGGESGGLVGMLLPHRPPRSRENADREGKGADARRLRVWVLRDGVPAPIRVSTGPSDGSRTVVTGGKLTAGTPLIVDMLRSVKP